MRLAPVLLFCLSLSGAAELARAEPFDFEGFKKRLPWIWEPPQQPQIPSVKDVDWPLDPIDAFVLTKLESESLTPAPPTTDRIWLRRAHFAITGLPPTPAEMTAFANDASPDQRKHAVRRLLASPHYGERWARHWMDLVRYAESRGHETDFIIANAYHYRNYLIRAFNADLPYDQFVTEHLAGDLLQTPRLHPENRGNESVLATGWPFFGEEVHSPVDIRQDECDRVDNKVDVLSKTFLGLTISCARCHDHKFDAIRQSDYYALSGFVLSSSYRQVRFESMAHNREIAADLDALRKKYRPHALRELAKRGRALVDGFEPMRLVTEAELPTRIAIPEDGSVRVIADYRVPEATAYRSDGPSFGRGVVVRGAVSLGQDAEATALRIEKYGAARRDPYWNGLAVIDSENDSGSLDSISRAGKTLRTPTVTLGSGKLHYLIRGKTKVYAAVSQHIMVTGPLHKTLLKEFKTDGESPRWVTHDLGRYTGLRAHIEFGAVGNEPLEILAVVEAGKPPPLLEEKAEFGRKHMELALAEMSGGRTPDPHLAPAAEWIVKGVDFKAREIADGEYLAELGKLRERTRWKSRTAVAWIGGNGVDENVLDRGSPKAPGETAARGLPGALGFPKIRTPDSGRLELVRQLTDPDNPLLARVLANRVWHHLFGRGIISTTDNFGWLGERPTHPELLDYLAVEFVEKHHWSIKSLIERMVLTGTFAMSSAPADAAFDQDDPDNLLLHRMPVRRLEAEVIRDSALAISGRLDRTVGGKPVPVHLTEFVIGRGRPGSSGPLDGAGRRSIYTAVRRNFLPTLMLAFDFPTPFSTVGKRDVTNVPAQSLALMNDTFLYEQAGVWADRVLREMADENSQDRVRRMFEEAFARPASDGELASCLDSLTEFATLYGGDADARDAWRDLCHSLFSMNDFIYLR